MYRLAALFVMAAAALVLASGAAYAEDKAKDKTHDGKVVSVAEGKLVMTDNDGKNEHSHAIGPAAKITLDGKEAKLGDLKAGDAITVSQGEGGKVTAVAAKRAK